MEHSGEMNFQRAAEIKAQIKNNCSKPMDRPWLSSGTALIERDGVDSKKWEKNITGQSLGWLRLELEYYESFVPCVFSDSRNDDRLISPRVRVKRVLGAYSDGRPFSVTLVSAVS